MDNELYFKYQNIVKGVARRYAGPFGMTYDDIEQQLWEYLITKMKKGKQLTPGLVARMCYDHAVDIYRKQRRYYDSTASITAQDYYTFEEDNGNNTVYKIQSSKFEDTSIVDAVTDLLSMYEKGSRERRYIICKLYNAGIITKELFELSGVDTESLVTPGEYDSEEAYQGILPGLNNRKISGSWLSARNKMRYEIYVKLLGIKSEEDIEKYLVSRMVSLVYDNKNRVCWYYWLVRDDRVKALYLNKKDIIRKVFNKYCKDKFYKIIDKDGCTGFILKSDNIEKILERFGAHIDNTDKITK